MPHPHTHNQFFVCEGGEKDNEMSWGYSLFLCRPYLWYSRDTLPKLFSSFGFFLSSPFPRLDPFFFFLWVGGESVCVRCICADEDWEDKSKGLLCVSWMDGGDDGSQKGCRRMRYSYQQCRARKGVWVEEIFFPCAIHKHWMSHIHNRPTSFIRIDFSFFSSASSHPLLLRI